VGAGSLAQLLGDVLPGFVVIDHENLQVADADRSGERKDLQLLRQLGDADLAVQSGYAFDSLINKGGAE